MRKQYFRERNNSVKNTKQLLSKKKDIPKPIASQPASLISTLFNGMSFGFGSEIGHTISKSLLNNKNTEDSKENYIDNCDNTKLILDNCLHNESGYNCIEKEVAYNNCLEKMKHYSKIKKHNN